MKITLDNKNVVNISKNLILFKNSSRKNIFKGSNDFLYLFKTKKERLEDYFDFEDKVFLEILKYIIQHLYEDDITLESNLIHTIEIKYKESELIEDLEEYLQAIKEIFNENNLHNFEEVEELLLGYSKFVLIQKFLKQMGEVPKEIFNSSRKFLDKYEKTVSIILDEYSNTFSEDYVSFDEEGLKKVQEKIKDSGQIREVKLFKDIKFLQTKRLGIIAAPPGVGKSMTLVEIAGDYTLHAPKDDLYEKNLIFYFTFENTEEETFVRLLANTLFMDMDAIYQDIEKNQNLEKYIQFFKEKKPAWNELIILEYPSGSLTVNNIQSIIEKFKRKYKNSRVYAVIIDYLDLVQPHKGDKRHEELAFIAEALKKLATKNECVVLTAAQINREGMRKMLSKNSEIGKDNLAGSFAILNHADVVLALSTDYSPEPGTKIAKFNVFKHRYFSDSVTIRAKFYTSKAKFKLIGGGEDEDISKEFISDEISEEDLIPGLEDNNEFDMLDFNEI